MPQASFSFTSVSRDGGLLRVLSNQCKVSQAFMPAGNAQVPPQVEFNAIWDTGATGCVITQRVVDACGLAPIRVTQVHVVGSVVLAEVYLINIYLPNNVAFAHVEVTKGELSPNMDMLIGMSIINQGDFAVTNANGLTKFSFRIPSLRHIDFVEEHKSQMQRHGGTKKQREKHHKTFGKNKRKKKE